MMNLMMINDMNNRLYYAAKIVARLRGWQIVLAPFFFTYVLINEPSIWAKHARIMQEQLNQQHNDNNI